MQLPFDKIRLIAKFEVKYQKKKKKTQGLIANYHIHINQFTPIYFFELYELYSQWATYIKVHSPDLLLSINYEGSEDEEKMFACLSNFN